MPAEALPELVHFTLPRGTQIAAYVGGPETGTPVVLLHGGVTDHALMSWRKTMPALVDAGYRVFAPNYPGYGASPPDDRITTTDDMIHLLEEMLDFWALPQAVLVGLSMGGAVALGYTLAHQERVKKLVLVGPYGIQDRVPYHFWSYLYLKVPGVLDFSWGLVRNSRSVARMMLNSIIRNPESRTDELLEEVLDAMKNPHSQRTFARWQHDEVRRDGVKTNYTERLHEITIPVLLVHGTHDTGVPLAYAERAASRLPNARLEVFENAGHWTQRDYPDRFNRLLLEFLAES